MFRKSNGNIVVFNIAAIQIDSSQEGLIVFKASNHEVVVVRILSISLFVANSGQIVCIVLDCEMDIVIV